MHKLKLFFSWQSDIKGNHINIRDALMMACDTIKKDGVFEIEYTESTWNISGSPIIEKAVMEKAKDCDIFVADITPVAAIPKKSLPNPNVMLELGIAKSCLVDDVILLLYTDVIKAETMPFDINHQRMSRFDRSTITDYVRAMAETAIKNPKHTSIFDNNDKFLFFDRNIKKNISSGKYLPNVYLENREVKQHLRDFVAPYPFCKLVLERCDMMDTYRINKGRRLRHKKEFIFDVSEYKSIPSEESLSIFYRRTKEFADYVSGKYNELHGNNPDYLSSSKYGQQVIHLQHIISRILIVTTSAGQGKTNLICDLVENILLKRAIPFVYLNGYEIDSNHIDESFVRMMLPTSKVSFSEAIQELATYCKYRRSPIVLIIDGLNENPNPEVFSRNLEIFIEAILAYDCVKVIMTCRTEYYEECFSAFNDAFKDRMIRIENLNMNWGENDRERLLNNYLHHFNITAQFNHNVKTQLCGDFLLLRIFCEANRNKSLGPVLSIKREELFAEYYEIMTNSLIEKVRLENGYKLSTNKVQSFIMGLIEYMITNDRFFNVPLSYIESKFSKDENRIFSRFLEENILLRKDLTPRNKGLFGKKEVVNFTYDAFRDYLLSAYLSEYLFVRDRRFYEQCINEYTQKGHQLREGIVPFLFVHSKNKGNEDAILFFKSFDWYVSVFEQYIWDISDAFINDDDVYLIRQRLNSENPLHVAQRLVFYGRWDESKYPRLNIRILLEHLSALEDHALESFIEKVWSDTPKKGWRRMEDKTPRTLMIESLEEVLDNQRICNNDYFHNLFELLLYIAICSKGNGFDIFMRYYFKYKNIDMLNRVGKTTQSDKLFVKLNEIKGIQ